MTKSDQMRAIMFADVSGSSALYKNIGNLKAKTLIDKVINFMILLTEENQGTVVKTIGDEIMSRFDTADNACLAAIAIQQACSQTETQDLTICIGISYGPTLLEKEDVFGNTVNDAAFVTHIARSEEIVLTRMVVDAASTYLGSICHEFDRVHIKGESKSNKTIIYRLPWEHPTTRSHSVTTVMSIKDTTQISHTHCLCLDVGNESYAISSDKTPYTIGRDHRNVDLYINNVVASRAHCHIDYRRGKYVLVDHSTNGTYVVTPDQPEIYLRREELPLLGAGTIGIGQPSGKAGKMLIRYSL